jgi:hypothetical protein
VVLRALSEAGGYFSLGAAHSLGNLGLRIALLDKQAGLRHTMLTIRNDLAKTVGAVPMLGQGRAWVLMLV